MRLILAVSAVAVLLAGCGSGPALVVKGESAGTAYDGPMTLPLDYSDEAAVMARSGAAGRALECVGTPYNGGGADYEDGLASAQDDAESALQNLFDEDGVAWGVPTDGYRIERRDDGRVLFSYDVDGRTKASFIAADDVDDWKHHTGWGIEAWAQCDPAEFPADFTDGLDLDVWTDAAGARVPVTEVISFPGAEHCDWQDITFLRLGEDPQGINRDNVEEYLRDTHGELADILDGRFRDDARLPDGARDTGWHQAGRELWLVTDKSAAYLVSLDDATDVERWPASKQPVGCA